MKTHSSKHQIIFGRQPLLEAINGNVPIDHILIRSGLKGSFIDTIKEYCSRNNIPLKRVPQIKLDKTSHQQNHQGVIAFASLIEYKNLKDIVPFLFEKGEVPLILILDGVTDVRNLGAIARSAEIFGCHAIIIPLSDTAQINEVAIKTSAGALLNIDICRESNLKSAVKFLKNSGIQILASDMKSDRDIYSFDLNVPLALVMGSEQYGVSSDLLSASTETFSIPQLGSTDSLNVSVASGICLYECIRQRINTQ